ncbi:MAG TPA: alpha/beta hydrolase [Steroidobacter sp.]|uniref:alpha/beta fold hydrolase n=1 Tax=Steroidobacter sp. TaxID=1978227 RepID=UPI002ED7FAC7
MAGAHSNHAVAQSASQLTFPADLPRADESGRVRVSDIDMWYAVFNKGGENPVLLIHGGLGSADNWGNQLPALIKSHKVIVADSRGHGRSTRSERRIGYAIMTDDYVALLDRLEIDKVALVGLSDGAIIGLDMAMRYPERLSKLWAFGANYNVAGLRPDAPDVDNHPLIGPALRKLRQDYEKLSPTPTDYDSFFKAVNEMWAKEPDYQPEQLARITTPTVIADGEHDEFIKRAHTEELARLVPGAKLVILPDVGHLASWQNPRLFNEEMMRFLGEGAD